MDIEDAWRADLDERIEYMQTAAFAAAVRRMLDEPLRVDLSERLQRTQRGGSAKIATGDPSEVDP